MFSLKAWPNTIIKDFLILMCRYACYEWGVGIEIGKNVKRDEVEKDCKGNDGWR